MNRRQFVLSWGRKLFFGLAWPLFSLLGLIYLQSFVLPQTTMESLYFLVSFIGHYGLICSVAYFILYCPVVLVFPTYYFSRIWSLLIIILIGCVLFFDAYVFSQFRFHLNSFFLNLIFHKGLTSFISSKAVVILLTVAVLAGSIIIWFRGNITWRQMQKRFSNPVSQWYLVLIFVCLGVSHLIRINSSTSLARMQALFPANFALSGSIENPPLRDIGKLYYPKDELKCTGRGHPNIIFIIVRGLKANALDTSDLNPQLSHLKQHGSVYQSHYSTSNDSRGALFSLFYSLPATYSEAFQAENKTPAFIEELKKRKYQLVSFSQVKDNNSFALPEVVQQEVINNSLSESWKAWSSGGTITPPLFAYFYLDGDDMTRVDRDLRALILGLLQDRVLKDATFVIAGDTGVASHESDGLTEEKVKTPLMVIWPHRAHKEFSQFTSHYDVVPTLMRELFNCKSPIGNYSIGKSLNESPANPWHILEIDKGLGLMDMEKSNFTRITATGGYDVRDFSSKEIPTSKGRPELMLKALKDNFRFYKR